MKFLEGLHRNAAQWTLEASLCLRANRVHNRLVDLGMRGIREALVRTGDPCVHYDIGGRSLILPLSHELPYYRRTHHGYGDNFGYLAKAIEAALSGITVIDIGANVGDSVAIARGVGVDAAFLCIEGSARYVSMLNENLEKLGGVQVVHAVVGRTSGASLGRVETAGGTGRFVTRSTGTTKVVTLDEILDESPRFQQSKLLKVDVDGADFDVLAGGRRFLTREKPVVLVEYDPALQRESGNDAVDGLEELGALGYEHFIAYDNLGVMLMRGRLSNKCLVLDLTDYAMAKPNCYWDLALFAKEDDTLCDAVVAAETRRREAIGCRR